MLNQIIQDRLVYISEHASVIKARVQGIGGDEEFLASEAGSQLIDSLITRLQAMTENIIRIQKADLLFFQQAIPLDVTPIIRFRDLASHHYEKLEGSLIFEICNVHVPPVADAVQVFLEKVKQ